MELVMNYFIKNIFLILLLPYNLFAGFDENLQHVMPELNEIVARANTQIALQRFHAIARLTKQAQLNVGIAEKDICPVILNIDPHTLDPECKELTQNSRAAYSLEEQVIYLFDTRSPLSIINYRLLHEAAHRWQDIRDRTTQQQAEPEEIIEHEADMRALKSLTCPKCIQTITHYYKNLPTDAIVLRRLGGYATIEDFCAIQTQCANNPLCEYHTQVYKIMDKTNQTIIRVLRQHNVLALTTNIDFCYNTTNDQLAQIVLISAQQRKTLCFS